MKVKNPLTEALVALCGAQPPGFTLGVWRLDELDDREVIALQDWCCANARPSWSTGIALLEAADAIVHEAVGNGNIFPKIIPIYKVWWNGAGALEISKARATKMADHYRVVGLVPLAWDGRQRLPHAWAHETPEAAIAAFIEGQESRAQIAAATISSSQILIAEARALAKGLIEGDI